jgi:hypothetical protein
MDGPWREGSYDSISDEFTQVDHDEYLALVPDLMWADEEVSYVTIGSLKQQP